MERNQGKHNVLKLITYKKHDDNLRWNAYVKTSVLTLIAIVDCDRSNDSDRATSPARLKYSEKSILNYKNRFLIPENP